MQCRTAFVHVFSLLVLLRAIGGTRTRARLQRGAESDLRNADVALQAELGALTAGSTQGFTQDATSSSDADPLVSAALGGDPFEVGADHPDQLEVNAGVVAPTAAPLGEQKLALWAASQGATESSLQSEVSSLKAQSAALQNDMTKATALRIQANRTQAELDRLHQHVRPATIAELQKDAEALEKKHANLLMQLNEKDGEIVSLERDLKPLQAKVHAAQKEAADLKARSKTTGLLQGKLQAAHAEEARLRHTVDSLRKRLVALQGTSKLPKETLVDAALARTENATALLETQNEMLHERKQEAQREADAQMALMEAKVRRAEARRAQLEAGLRHHIGLVKSARKNLTLLVQQKHSLLSERAALQKRVAGLGPVEAELRTKGAEVKRLRRQVSLLDTSVSTARSSLLFQDNSRLEEQVTEVEKENNELSSQRQKQEKQGVAMEVELRNANKAVVSLRREVVKAQSLRKHTAGVWHHVKSIDRENAALRRGIALLARRLKRIQTQGTDAVNSDF